MSLFHCHLKDNVHMYKTINTIALSVLTINVLIAQYIAFANGFFTIMCLVSSRELKNVWSRKKSEKEAISFRYVI